MTQERPAPHSDRLSMVDLPRTTRSHPRGLSMFDLSGKVALVTGSSRGIGLGLAAGLAAAGAHVVVHGRDHDRVAEVRDRLAATGGSSSAAAFDLTDAAEVTTGIAALTEIHRNALAPGYFDTDLTSALVADESFSTWVAGRTPAGRRGQIHDLVGTCVFLASGASDFVNGQIIHVDGGMSAVV